jgi:hypothetical protein
MESLVARGLLFFSREDLVPALTCALAIFEVHAAELITWLRRDANVIERILPKYITDGAQETVEGAHLLLEFDKDAQLGVTHIQTLVHAVTDAVLTTNATADAASSSARIPPAFTSFASLVVAMRSHRARELSHLHAWLETPSASTLFVTCDGVELSATEDELQRLLLAASSWPRVHRTLQMFQAQAREFTSLTSLAVEVTQAEEVSQLSIAGVVSFLECSGLLAGELKSEDETRFRARTEQEGTWRMQNELISIQQI